MTTYVATQIGFATSWMNPFSVAIRAGPVGCSGAVGLGFPPSFMWSCFTLFGVVYYPSARAFRQTASGALADLRPGRPFPRVGEHLSRDRRGLPDGAQGRARRLLSRYRLGDLRSHSARLLHPEIATQFFATGLACGSRRTDLPAPGDVPQPDRRIRSATAPSALLGAALIVGFAKGVVLLLGGNDPHAPSLLNTILHFFGSLLDGLPGFAAAWSMYASRASSISSSPRAPAKPP